MNGRRLLSTALRVTGAAVTAVSFLLLVTTGRGRLGLDQAAGLGLEGWRGHGHRDTDGVDRPAFGDGLERLDARHDLVDGLLGRRALRAARRRAAWLGAGRRDGRGERLQGLPHGVDVGDHPVLNQVFSLSLFALGRVFV